jgi:dehydrogenase/reductase SDR family protein 7B
MRLADKIVWITGASSGIGEALAVELSRYGARVVLSARRQAELERVRNRLVWPEKHLVLPLDLTDPGSFAGARDKVLEAFGRIDMLINNGGISQRSLVVDTDLAVDRRIMEINYFGTIALTRTVLPAMIERGGGELVVISSLVGELSTPLRSAYAASKHALHGWFEALRAEEYDRGIRVLMVMPGFIRTSVSLNALTGDGSAQGSMDAAQERGMSPELCAERIIDAVQRGREQVIIARRERLAVYLKRWLPWLYRKLIRRMKVT